MKEDNKILPEFAMQGETHKVKVLRVIDGDTAVIGFERRGEQVRYRLRMDGINAAEMKPRKSIPKEERDKIIAEAKKATNALRQRVENKIVTLKIRDGDDFGRILGTIYLENEKQSVNDWMLENKLAVVFTGKKAPKAKKIKQESKH